MMWSEMRKQKQNKKLISHRDFKKDYLRLAMQIWPNWICIWCRFYFEFFRNKNFRWNFFKLYFQRVVFKYWIHDKGSFLVFKVRLVAECVSVNTVNTSEAKKEIHWRSGYSIQKAMVTQFLLNIFVFKSNLILQIG